MEQSDFFERYQYDVTQDLLGGGGFGKVYRAYDDFRDRHVAIKIAEVLPDLEHLSLRHEVELSKKLPDHKHICHYEECYRFNMSNGVFDYGILQYYPEGNLSQVIKSSGLTSEQKTQLADGVIKGMAFLHKENVIHRDLKSSNILISKKGEFYTPKIADFGLSKTIDDMENTFHSNSFVGGSIAYSAPEQLTGGKVKSNLDIWSLGVILYEIFNGEVPFLVNVEHGSGDYARLELLSKINQAIVPDAVNNIPEPYRQLVLSCLIKDVDLRLQTMDQVIAVRDGKLKWKVPKHQASSDETFVVDRETLRRVSGKSSKKSLPPNTEQSIVDDLEPTNKKKSRRPLVLIFLGVLISLTAFWGKQKLDSNLQIKKEGSKYSIKNSSGDIIDIGFEQVERTFLGNMKGYRNDSIFTYSRLGVLKKVTSDPTTIKEGQKSEEEIAIVNGTNDLINHDANSTKDIEKDELENAIKEDNADWIYAIKNKTVKSFESYLRKHPRGIHANDAQQSIDQLLQDLGKKNEGDLWQLAEKSKSIATLQSFITQFPNSDKVRTARIMIKSIKIADEEALWKAALMNPSKVSLGNYLKTYPRGVHRIEAQSRIDVLNNQLASLYFDRIKASKDVDRLISFIDKYPDFDRLPNAKELLRNWQSDLDLNALIARNDSDELINWLSKNANHIRKAEVEALLVKKPATKEINIMPPSIISIEKGMVEISSTSYTLGCSDCKGDRKLPKDYSIGSIKISKYEVTNKVYKQIMGTNPPSDNSDCKSCPVTNVSLYDVRRFLERLNGTPGNPYKYRLPTEAEWEYAAKGGSRNPYSGSKELNAVAQYKANSKRSVHKVGQKKPNRFGLYDMSGNVYEWTESWYDERGYNVDNPTKEEKVIRGGGWNSNSKKCEVAARSAVYPGDKNPFTGFRLVRE